MKHRIIVGGAWALFAAGLFAALAGVVDGAAVWHRVWPVLAFLLLIKLASDLIEQLGVFDLTSLVLAQKARGSVPLLFAGFCLIAIVLTAVLSLDATVVLMTPVAITLARRLDLSAAPFLLATIWIANIGSLFLPVSNLTNLLAVQHTSWSVTEFLALMGPVQIALLATCLIILTLMYRRDLSRRYDMALVRPSPFGPSRTIAAAVILAILAFAWAVVAGIEPWLATLVLDGVLLILRAVAALKLHLSPTLFVRASSNTSYRLLRGAPWTMAAFALGLFFLIDPVAGFIATSLGPVINSDGYTDLLAMSALGSASASAANNLPAFLALEPSATSELQLAALLVGVNAGPLLTPWGSLATLLWLSMCADRAQHVSLRHFLLASLLAVPVLLLVGAAVLTL